MILPLPPPLIFNLRSFECFEKISYSIQFQYYFFYFSHSTAGLFEWFPQKVRWQNWWIPSVAPMTESVDSLSRSDAEIANKWIPSEGRMTELMDSLSSSDDRIGRCPQQVRCHLVLIWSILDPLTWFLTHFGAFRWKLPFETCLSLGPIKTLSR